MYPQLTRILLALIISFLALESQSFAFQPIGAQRKPYDQRDTDAARERDQSFHRQADYASSRKSTTVNLRAVETVSDLNGIQLRHHSFNGDNVGPTIRVKPGSQLRIHLQNDLPPEPPSAGGHDNQPHGLNTTNLHTHGLHVSPQSPADDIFKEIKPKESFDFVFDIHPKHPAGTFWYHPHKHGSTAYQLASGMSGAFIVEGGLDHIPQIKAAQERIMVLQQFMFEKDSDTFGHVSQTAVYEGGEFVQAINGVVTPTLVMRPGEIQRWRIIHAGTTEAITLDLEGILFQEIAVDGLATGRMQEKKALVLFPGYRSDVLVQAPLVEGTRLLYTAIRDPKLSIREQIVERSNLLRLVIEGEPLPMQFPSADDLKRVAAFSQDDVPKDDELAGLPREIVLNMGASYYHVNDKAFADNRIDHQLRKGTAEEWKLTSRRGVHPFHIHVNPFAVKPTIEGEPWVWRDTIAVSLASPATIRTRYLDFTGDTVLHCHNLIHEDLGMMQRVQLQSKPPTLVSSSAITGDAERSLAQPWGAIDREGKAYNSEMYQGKLVMLVLHRGMECLHCAEQLSRLRDENHLLREVGIHVVALSPKLPAGKEVDQVLSEFPFPILIDEAKEVFRNYRCIDESEETLHGLFLLDQQNRCMFAYRSPTAVKDPVAWAFENLQLRHKRDQK
jgi:FtsP/CotA-like multicopper oxidase with cupredoxin domain/peroxiredoxin